MEWRDVCKLNFDKMKLGKNFFMTEHIPQRKFNYGHAPPHSKEIRLKDLFIGTWIQYGAIFGCGKEEEIAAIIVSYYLSQIPANGE